LIKSLRVKENIQVRDRVAGLDGPMNDFFEGGFLTQRMIEIVRLSDSQTEDEENRCDHYKDD
jgi:hypothetical protein